MNDLDTKGAIDPEELESETKPIPLVELTSRDIEVFKLIHEHRYLAYGQIKEGFWKDCTVHAKTCYRRVGRLINSGYLEKIHSKRKGLDLYLLTQKSFEVLKDRKLDSGVNLYQPTNQFDRYVDHDLKVASVRLIFKSLGLDSWTSERVLRERDHLFNSPDGLLTIKGKKIAIEFENHLTKSQDRYQALFSEYSEHKTFAVSFWIIHGITKDWLIRSLDYDPKRIWITTYQEIVQNRENALFENNRANFRLSRLL